MLVGCAAPWNAERLLEEGDAENEVDVLLGEKIPVPVIGVCARHTGAPLSGPPAGPSTMVLMGLPGVPGCGKRGSGFGVSPPPPPGGDTGRVGSGTSVGSVTTGAGPVPGPPTGAGPTITGPPGTPIGGTAGSGTLTGSVSGPVTGPPTGSGKPGPGSGSGPPGKPGCGSVPGPGAATGGVGFGPSPGGALPPGSVPGRPPARVSVRGRLGSPAMYMYPEWSLRTASVRRLITLWLSSPKGSSSAPTLTPVSRMYSTRAEPRLARCGAGFPRAMMCFMFRSLRRASSRRPGSQITAHLPVLSLWGLLKSVPDQCLCCPTASAFSDDDPPLASPG